MKKATILIAALFFLALSIPAQSKSNDAISRQISALKSGKAITLTYDQNSNVSKLMAVSENFPDQETGRAGIMAMNFAIGFMYPGKSLISAPDKLLIAFWVMTKKPRFAASHNLLVPRIDLDLGAARYVAKPRLNMEYLNFDLSREDLEKIAAQPNAQIRLGNADLTFTRAQIKAISDVLIISDPAR